jgi:hypothetical protein
LPSKSAWQRLLRRGAAALWAILKILPHLPAAILVTLRRDRAIAAHQARVEFDRLDRIRHPEKYCGRQ